ncbi:HTH_Tnp_Tc3_2 domain-containing protein [Trichonephila clavipes]|nr:HTH_Tnp_Tc3_2 domain-containing protein [Trichonephila clavipes]
MATVVFPHREIPPTRAGVEPATLGSRNAYQYVSGIDKGQNVAYRDCVCGLSYRTIDAHVGGDPMTVSRIRNLWVQDDREAPSRTLSQELGPFARQVSARTIRRHLQQHGLSAWRPWLRLPLTLHPRQELLQ